MLKLLMGLGSQKAPNHTVTLGRGLPQVSDRRATTIVRFNFLSSPMAKMHNFSVYHMQNFLNFPKNGLTFYHSPFLLGVNVRKLCPHFFWDTLYRLL